MAISENAKERLRTATVEVLLDLRAAYLAGGASPLKHWDQLHDRLRSAARTTDSPEEWHSAMLRSLQLAAANSSACSGLKRLVDLVHELDARRAWFDLLEREHGYLIALTRLDSEKRREARTTLDHHTITGD